LINKARKESKKERKREIEPLRNKARKESKEERKRAFEKQSNKRM
jgi:hypothetical protein